MNLTSNSQSIAFELVKQLTPALENIGNKLGELINDAIDSVVDTVTSNNNNK